VEVLIAVVILGIGIVCSAQCLMAGFFLTRTATQTGTATLYAQAALEDILSLGTPPANGAVTTTITDQNMPTNTKQTVTVADYLTALNLKLITVDVSWGGANKKIRHVILQSVMPNRILPNT